MFIACDRRREWSEALDSTRTWDTQKKLLTPHFGTALAVAKFSILLYRVLGVTANLSFHKHDTELSKLKTTDTRFSPDPFFAAKKLKAFGMVSSFSM